MNTFAALPLLLSVIVTPDDPRSQTPSGWRVHDEHRPAPASVEPAGPGAPPSDAVVLFDGSNLEHWQATDGGEARWVLEEGAVVAAPGSGSLVSKQSFGDVQMHIEWSSPSPPKGEGQDRGNSGVYFMGRYEVQVLDSFEAATYPDGQAGSIYGQYPPLVNASLPPGQWQSYDIAFRRPRFEEDGTLREPARLTVIHNGVLVQNNEELWGGTSWLSHNPYRKHADALPMSLQDHGHPVRYRNIWVRRLPERPAAGRRHPVVLELSEQDLGHYVGDYKVQGSRQVYAIQMSNGRLELHMSGKSIPMVLLPEAHHTFAVRDTAASVVFELDDQGRPGALTFHLGSSKRRAVR